MPDPLSQNIYGIGIYSQKRNRGRRYVFYCQGTFPAYSPNIWRRGNIWHFLTFFLHLKYFSRIFTFPAFNMQQQHLSGDVMSVEIKPGLPHLTPKTSIFLKYFGLTKTTRISIKISLSASLKIARMWEPQQLPPNVTPKLFFNTST